MSVGDYLRALDAQRDALADNLNTMGVAASRSEKLNTLVPKVLDIRTMDEDALSLKEDKINKVTVINDESTDIEYPSAKAVYEMFKYLLGRIKKLESGSAHSGSSVSIEDGYLVLDDAVIEDFILDLSGNYSAISEDMLDFGIGTFNDLSLQDGYLITDGASEVDNGILNLDGASVSNDMLNT